MLERLSNLNRCSKSRLYDAVGLTFGFRRIKDGFDLLLQILNSSIFALNVLFGRVEMLLGDGNHWPMANFPFTGRISIFVLKARVVVPFDVVKYNIRRLTCLLYTAKI